MIIGEAEWRNEIIWFIKWHDPVIIKVKYNVMLDLSEFVDTSVL